MKVLICFSNDIQRKRSLTDVRGYEISGVGPKLFTFWVRKKGKLSFEFSDHPLTVSKII